MGARDDCEAKDVDSSRCPTRDAVGQARLFVVAIRALEEPHGRVAMLESPVERPARVHCKPTSVRADAFAKEHP